MAGYITQRREIPFDQDYSWDLDVGYGWNVSRGKFVPRSTEQVTTSFRSGKSTVGQSDDSDYTPTTRDALIRYVNRHEDRKHTTDSGHTFKTSKSKFTLSHPRVTLTTPQKDVVYNGPLMPFVGYAAYSNLYPAPSDYKDARFHGPKAIEVTIPTNPIVSLAVTLAELKREGLPHLSSAEVLRDRTMTLRNMGSEYLNVEFGWKPLVNDLAKAMYAVSQAERLIAQTLRDSGKVVRRDYTFPEEKSTEVVVHYKGLDGAYANVPSNHYYSAYLYPNRGRGDFTETLETTRRVWFKGAYSYHFALGSDKGLFGKVRDLEKKANRLLGLRVTPEVLWNLQPWSWLADWHANIGTNIHNAVAFANDGLVLRYGYLMCTTVQKRVLTVSGGHEVNGPLPSVTATFETITKERVQATPFGFALDPGSFTARQWAILAALGMTKTPGRLPQMSG